MANYQHINPKSHRDETLLTVDVNLQTGSEYTLVPHGTTLFGMYSVVLAGLNLVGDDFRRLRCAPPAVNKVLSLRDILMR